MVVLVLPQLRKNGCRCEFADTDNWVAEVQTGLARDHSGCRGRGAPACAQKRNPWEQQRSYAQMRVLWSRLRLSRRDGFRRCEESFFQLIPQKRVIVRKSEEDWAEALSSRMQKEGVKLDTFLLNNMLNLYSRLGQFSNIEELLTVIEAGPYVADINTYNILINAYGRSGFIEKMEEIFQSLPAKNLKPSVVTWTSRLGAYSKKKQYQRCLEIFEEMIDEGCYPDGGTTKVLISSCSSEDQIEQVTIVIRSMHKNVKTVQLV
nr:pentatricopeptide repeat-containing protein At2g35130-like [Nicotiana tomentosiformis]